MGKLLSTLKFLNNAQVAWIVKSLCPSSAPSDLVNPRQLESGLLQLKSASILSADTQRSLIRLRKFIQETLRMSLVDAFTQMSGGSDNLSREELKDGFAKLGINFPYSEAGLIYGALKVDESLLTLETWVKVLCGATVPIDEHKLPQARASAASKPIILASATHDPRYTPLLSASSRPITAANLLLVSGRPLLRKAVADESDCVSSTHWSDTSSTKAADDLPRLLTAAPGTKLIEAARLLTNSAELGEAQFVFKEMRSLGTHAYSGPGRHHEVLGEVEAGGVVKVVEINGVWAKVLCGVYEGWVPLCKLDEEVERRLYSRHDHRMQPPEVRQLGTLSQIYVRKEPAWGSKALAKISAGKQTEVVGCNAQWAKVTCEGGEHGWVPLQHTSMTTTGTSFEKEALRTWAPDMHSHSDLFDDYDRKSQSFLAAPVLPRASLTALKQSVRQKMVNLNVQYKSILQEKLDRKLFRQRTVLNWIRLELSQAFQCALRSQWHRKTISLSRYDRYVQQQVEEAKARYQDSRRAVKVRKDQLRLAVTRSAADLRATLQREERAIHLSREQETSLRRSLVAKQHALRKSASALGLRLR